MHDVWLTMLSGARPQWHGIWRPPDAGSSAAPTACKQHLDRRDAEREHERTVAVVREEPVVRRAQLAGEPEEQRFVAGAGDLEERPVLLAERDLAVVAVTRDEREPEVVERLVERDLVLALLQSHCTPGRRSAAVYGRREAERRVPWTAVTDASPPAEVVLPWRRRAPRATTGFLSPAVRRLAAERNVDVATLNGSGEGGRVTVADVMDGASRSVRVPLNRVQQRSGVALLASKATSTHTYAVIECDYEHLDVVRRAERVGWRAAEGFSLTYLPFVATAVVDALHEFPMLNATVADDTLVMRRDVQSRHRRQPRAPGTRRTSRARCRHVATARDRGAR